jgi:hypothetical protein
MINMNVFKSRPAEILFTSVLQKENFISKVSEFARIDENIDSKCFNQPVFIVGNKITSDENKLEVPPMLVGAQYLLNRL